MKFTLEKFVEIFEAEYKNIDNRPNMPRSKMEKHYFPKTVKYLDDHIYRTFEGSYFVADGEDKLKQMSEKTFDSVFGKTIKEYNQNLMKHNIIRYACEIYDEDFAICHKTRRINLAHPFNFKNVEIELIQEEKELYDYLMDEFIYKVICNSQDETYRFLLDLVSCYTHRKQSQIILILVGLGGTGKSKFGELIQALLGRGCKAMTDDVLSGKDMFNSVMIGTAVGILEETSGKGESNYTDIQKTMKRLATSKYLTCRKMQTDAFEVTNVINFFMITNYIRDVQTDRRNFTIEPATTRMNDKGFYKKITGIINNQRIMQHLFNELYKREFNVWERILPSTEVNEDLKDQKNNQNPTNDFIIHLCSRKEENKEHMNLIELYEEYKDFCQSQGKAFYNSRLSENIFRSHIRQMLDKVEYHKANKSYYDTTKEGLKKVLEKFKISEDYIERKKKEFNVSIDETANIYDVFEVPKEDRPEPNTSELLKTIEKQNEMIKKLQEEIQNLKNEKCEKVVEKVKKIKVTKECEKAWDALDDVIN